MAQKITDPTDLDPVRNTAFFLPSFLLILNIYRLCSIILKGLSIFNSRTANYRTGALLA
jgi:hypothetical protein